jgi:hypothetical protein
MPYHIEHDGNHYKVVVDATGRVVGTHPSKAQAQAQLGALYANVPEATEKMIINGGDGWSIEFGTPDCQHGYAIVKTGTGQSIGCYLTKSEAQEALKGLDNDKIDLLGDEVRTTKTPEEYKENNTVNKCMTCGCDDLGNDHHYISDEEKCLYCVTKGQGPCWDGYEYAGTKEQNGKTVPNCIPKKIKKSEDGYKPNAGMKAAAHKALKWKEDGKANGAGTAVGWGRARQIVNGESLSLDTVKRMYSFFSRHEVDKQGKEWDKPSHGKVMWYAWGGDAGFAWSRAIVERENKMEKGDSIWSGVFIPSNKGQMGPDFNSQDQDARYYFPSKATYENDGKSSAGYGNRSSNQSIPTGTYTPDKTTKPYNG